MAWSEERSTGQTAGTERLTQALPHGAVVEAHSLPFDAWGFLDNGSSE